MRLSVTMSLSHSRYFGCATSDPQTTCLLARFPLPAFYRALKLPLPGSPSSNLHPIRQWRGFLIGLNGANLLVCKDLPGNAWLKSVTLLLSPSLTNYNANKSRGGKQVKSVLGRRASRERATVRWYLRFQLRSGSS